MSDNEIVEIAKATSEVAKTGGKAIDATSAFGRFCDRVLGDGIVDGFGIISDRIKYVRVRQAIKLEERVTKLLAEARVARTRPVSPVVALPIFEAATIEEDETLHSAWANLLAVAMNPDRSEIKRGFSGILSQLDPFDVRLFELMASTSYAQNHRPGISFLKRDIEYSLSEARPLKMQIRAEDTTGTYVSLVSDDGLVADSEFRQNASAKVEASLNNLIRNGLLGYAVVEERFMSVNNRAASFFRGTEDVVITALGLEFFEAVAR